MEASIGPPNSSPAVTGGPSRRLKTCGGATGFNLMAGLHRQELQHLGIEVQDLRLQFADHAYCWKDRTEVIRG